MCWLYWEREPAFIYPSTHNTVDLLSLFHPLHSCQLSTFTVSKMESYIRKREKRCEFLCSELQKSECGIHEFVQKI